MLRRRFLLVPLAAALAGCTAYYPAPAPGPSTYDRAWDAALGAATDSGVVVTSADRHAGQIRGSKSGAAVIINVLTQADGRVRVEFTAPKSVQRNPTLTDQLTAAYNRRMGR